MKLIVALTLLLAGVAHATGSPPAPEPPDTHSEAAAASNAAAVGIGIAKAEGVAHSTSAASQNQTQSAVFGAEATNAGNSQSLTVESHYREMRQAPASFAPAIYASGPCAYGWSAGVSFPGGSANGGKAKPDVDCNRREAVRILTPLNPVLALKVMCADPIVAQVADKEKGDCVYVPQVVATPAPPPDLSQYPKRDELVEILRERDRRIMQKATGK